MEVLIDNRQSRHKISLKKIRQTVRVVLNALDFPNGEISILLVDDPQIAKFNQEYLNRKGPTNVIAFSMREGEFSHLNPQLLGDVVISMETVARESSKADIGIQKRFNELLIHGILHLLGYDHERSERSAQIMQKKTQELLDIILKVQTLSDTRRLTIK